MAKGDRWATTETSRYARCETEPGSHPRTRVRHRPLASCLRSKDSRAVLRGAEGKGRSRFPARAYEPRHKPIPRQPPTLLHASSEGAAETGPQGDRPTARTTSPSRSSYRVQRTAQNVSPLAVTNPRAVVVVPEPRRPGTPYDLVALALNQLAVTSEISTTRMLCRAQGDGVPSKWIRTCPRQR